MTKFKKGDWVQVVWDRVYPKLKGHVKRQSGKETTVVVPELGTIDFPTDKLKPINEPERH